jgi:hypothetical protein
MCDALTGLLQTDHPTFLRPAFEVVVNNDIHVALLSLALDSQIELSERFALLLLTVWRRFAHIYAQGLYEVLDNGLLHSLSSPKAIQVRRTCFIFRCLATEPQFFVDVFVNYDCGPTGRFRSIFQKSIESLASLAYPDSSLQITAKQKVVLVTL